MKRSWEKGIICNTLNLFILFHPDWRPRSHYISFVNWDYPFVPSYYGIRKRTLKNCKFQLLPMSIELRSWSGSLCKKVEFQSRDQNNRILWCEEPIKLCNLKVRYIAMTSSRNFAWCFDHVIKRAGMKKIQPRSSK